MDRWTTGHSEEENTVSSSLLLSVSELRIGSGCDDAYLMYYLLRLLKCKDTLSLKREFRGENKLHL